MLVLESKIPPNAPNPRGKLVQVNYFVVSYHARDRETRWYQTGIILYCISVPIICYSKSQKTVERSTYGAKFVTLRITTDSIDSLRYRLRMIGVPIEEAENVFCENESVYRNELIDEYQLKKKHQAICFHQEK